MAVRAGRLRHRVELQRATKTRAATGETVYTWGKLVNWWVSIEPLQGREYMEAQQITSAATHRVRMRAYSGLTTEDRILHEARALNIISIINVKERDWEYEVMCKEAV